MQIDETRSIGRTTFAQFFNCNAATIDEFLEQDMPHNEDGTFDLQKIVEWMLTNASNDNSDMDAMSEVEDEENISPRKFPENRERVRLQCEILRLQLSREQGQIVSKDAIHTALGDIAKIIRGLGEQLQKEFGAEAAEILNSNLRDLHTQLDRLDVRDLSTVSPIRPHLGRKPGRPNGARKKR